MSYWIDLETASSEKIGDGPLTQLFFYEQVRRLNRAGEFSTQFSLSGTRYAALSSEVDSRLGNVLRRYIRLYAQVGSSVLQIGRGIIETQQIQISAPSQVNVSLRGDDWLRELAWKTVGFVAVEETLTDCVPLAVYRHDPDADENLVLEDDRLGITSSQFIYAAYTDPFSALHLVIAGDGNSQNNTLTVQILRKTGEVAAWESITATDGTADGTKALAQSGTVSWTIPTFWERMRHNEIDGYWVRLSVDNSTSGIDWGSGHEITGPGPTTGGLATLLAYATGWSLDTTNGYGTTGAAVRWKFAGESVLAALIKLADLTGESFRLGDGRSVLWLRSDTPNSGIRAVSYSGDPEMINNSDVALITNFIEERSSYDSLIGRLYVTGADVALLAQTTKTAPTGYTVDSDARGQYIQHDSTWNTYGQSAFYTSRARTPDELYDDVYQELERRRTIYEAYNVTVTKLDVATVRPGQLLRVVYQKTQDGVMLYDVNADFVILEMRERLDGSGRRTVTMRLANQPRWPRLIDEEALARIL